MTKSVRSILVYTISIISSVALIYIAIYERRYTTKSKTMYNSPEFTTVTQENKHFIFHAIHKTGTTVTRLQLQNFVQNTFLREHFAFDAIQFTILREPMQQMLSYIHFRCDRFVSSKEWQCRVNDDELVKGYMNDSMMDFRKKNTLHRPIFFITGNPNPKHGTSYVKAAAFLEQLDFVGIYEDLGRTWCIIRHILNWPRNFFPQENITISKTKLVDQTIATNFKLYYADDYRLYEYARELYATHVKKYETICPVTS